MVLHNLLSYRCNFFFNLLKELLAKENLPEIEKAKFIQHRKEMDKLYVDAAKGAFV